MVTTVTPTGQAAARKLFEPLTAAGRSVVVTYLPFDLGLLVGRFLDRYAPRALVLFESELWPLLLRDCRRRSIPVAVLNARISDRGYGRMKRAGRLYRRFLLDPLGRLGAQSPQDEERLLSLGARPARTSLTGNLKFDTPEPVPVAGLEHALRELAAGRPILVAGSTMPDEEPIVLDAFERLDRETLLVLAPRHPERFDEVWRMVEERSLNAVRRSGMTIPQPAATPPTESPACGTPGAVGSPNAGQTGSEAGEPSERDRLSRVVLLDSLGELAAIYRLGAAAFIGGTLVPTGGHNPIEAARFGVPVIVGPSMENFRRIAHDLEAADGLTLAADGEALTEAWRRLLDRPDEAAEQGGRGLAIIDRNRGAVGRSVELLSQLVDLD